MSLNHNKYTEYNQTLRQWFVAFGVGGLAVFLVEDSARTQLIDANEIRSVALLFLAGAASQIFVAFINKIANWYKHNEIENNIEGDGLKYRISHWLLEQFWIDIVCDIITIFTFGYAVYRVFAVFAG